MEPSEFSESVSSGATGAQLMDGGEPCAMASVQDFLTEKGNNVILFSHHRIALVSGLIGFLVPELNFNRRKNVTLGFLSE